MHIDIGRRGWVAVIAALVVATTALMVLASVADAVREQDGVTTSDGTRLHWFLTQRSTGTIDLARVLTEIGGVLVLVGLAVLAGVVLWRRGQPMLVALAPSTSLALAGLAVAVGKPFFGRARPDLALHLVTENEPSFPSGHSADSTALLLSIGLVLAVFVFRRPLARVAAVAVSVLTSIGIGLSRLVLGVHWPTDVVAGWALGGAVAVIVVTGVFVVTRTAPAPGRGPGPADRSPVWRLWRLATRVRRPEPPAMAFVASPLG